jgi:antitoxin PrlF
MSVTITEVSTITAKGQTTVPKAVRQALGVDYGGRIAFRVSDAGVTVMRADDDIDPAMASFLDFLVADIKARPDRLAALSPDLAAHLQRLTDGVDAEPDSVIEGDVDL